MPATLFVDLYLLPGDTNNRGLIKKSIKSSSFNNKCNKILSFFLCVSFIAFCLSTMQHQTHQKGVYEQ